MRAFVINALYVIAFIAAPIADPSTAQVEEIFLKRPNVGLHGNGKALPVAPAIYKEVAEKCDARFMVTPMLRKKIDDARVFGRQRYRPSFARQARKPTLARGQ